MGAGNIHLLGHGCATATSFSRTICRLNPLKAGGGETGNHLETRTGPEI